MLKIQVDRSNPIVQAMDYVYQTLGGSCDFVIAGGAPMKVLSLHTELGSSDIDLWFPDHLNAYNCGSIMSGSGFTALSDTANARTFSHQPPGLPQITVQAINRGFFPDIEQIFESFDFSICRVAYLDGYCYATEETLVDIQNKLIRADDYDSKPNNVSNRASRIAKYTSKGFVFHEEFILQSHSFELFKPYTRGKVSFSGGDY